MTRTIPIIHESALRPSAASAIVVEFDLGHAVGPQIRLNRQFIGTATGIIPADKFVRIPRGYTDFPRLAMSAAEKAEWAEVERLTPPNDRLLDIASRHRAPQEWYEESHENL